MGRPGFSGIKVRREVKGSTGFEGFGNGLLLLSWVARGGSEGVWKGGLPPSLVAEGEKTLGVQGSIPRFGG